MKNSPTGEGPEDRLSLEKDILINGERPDSLLPNDTREFKKPSNAQKPNRKITLIFILIPSLVITLTLLAYLDVRQRLGRLQTTGFREVQAFSESVLDRIKSLSYQYTELDQSVTDKLTSMEQSLSSIKEDMKSTQQEITKLTASKLDHKDFEAAEKKRSVEITEAVSALRKDVNQQSVGLEELIAQLNTQLHDTRDTLSSLGKDLEAEKNEMAELFHVIETIGKEDQEQEEAITALAKQKLDKEALDALLQNKLEKYEKQTGLLEKKITALEEEIAWFEKQANLIAPGQDETTVEKPHPNTGPTGEAGENESTSGPEKIIEQRIAQ